MAFVPLYRNKPQFHVRGINCTNTRWAYLIFAMFYTLLKT